MIKIKVLLFVALGCISLTPSINKAMGQDMEDYKPARIRPCSVKLPDGSSFTSDCLEQSYTTGEHLVFIVTARKDGKRHSWVDRSRETSPFRDKSITLDGVKARYKDGCMETIDGKTRICFFD